MTFHEEHKQLLDELGFVKDHKSSDFTKPLSGDSDSHLNVEPDGVTGIIDGPPTDYEEYCYIKKLMSAEELIELTRVLCGSQLAEEKQESADKEYLVIQEVEAGHTSRSIVLRILAPNKEEAAQKFDRLTVSLKEGYIQHGIAVKLLSEIEQH